MIEWLNSVFTQHTDIQAVVIIALICAVGLAFGKMKIFGLSLGVTFVFFIGIVAGHLGLSIDNNVLHFVESFGMVLYVYALGVQVGPGFFSAFARGGIPLNLLSLAVVAVSMLLAVGLVYVTPISVGDMMGVWCGATTNTPALVAAQQTLQQLGLPGSSAALGCAVTYPLGVVGVIIGIMVIRRLYVGAGNLVPAESQESNRTEVAGFLVKNPAIYGKTVEEIARESNLHFVISRLWRDGKVTIPSGDTQVNEGDRVLVTSNNTDGKALAMLFGMRENTDYNSEDIDWNAIDTQLVSQRILVTNHELNGKRLGSLRLRSLYGININRVYRSGVMLLADPGLRLQLGDRLTVVGERPSVERVAKVLGNAVKNLDEPNLVSVFIGMFLGLLLGSIPFHIPSMSMPVKLGLAGGPIIMGILVGTFGPRLHMVTYTTQSANLMLRAIGLSIYLACLGLDAGAGFFETVFRAEGALWVAIGFIITVVPCFVIGSIMMKLLKFDFSTTIGMLCGTMANPMALDYANDTIPGNNTTVSYATVYPLSLFVRVIMVQVVLLALL